jgi:hypothetical protein
LSISSFRYAQDRVRPDQDVSSQGEAETVPLRRADETILQPGQQRVSAPIRSVCKSLLLGLDQLACERENTASIYRNSSNVRLPA